MAATAEAKRLAQEAERKIEQCERDARGKRELLLAQLRQAREKLEARDLENIELRKRLAAEENDLATARDDAKDVRLKMNKLHKELLNLAQTKPDFPWGASNGGG